MAGYLGVYFVNTSPPVNSKLIAFIVMVLISCSAAPPIPLIEHQSAVAIFTTIPVLLVFLNTIKVAVVFSLAVVLSIVVANRFQVALRPELPCQLSGHHQYLLR